MATRNSVRAVRDLATRLDGYDAGRGGASARAAYRACARRLDAALARCPADALDIDTVEIPAVWDALAARYFEAHGHFPGQRGAAVTARALLARAAGSARTRRL